MKKIISLVSLCFLLLLAALPGQALHAAAAANDTPAITSMTLVLADGTHINASQKGTDLTFNLVGVPNQAITEVDFASPTATVVSFAPFDQTQISGFDTDLHFTNGIATLNKQKFIGWYSRLPLNYTAVSGQLDPNLTASEAYDQFFTVDNLRKTFFDTLDPQSNTGGPVPLFVKDQDGNESQYNLSIVTDAGWNAVNSDRYYYKADGSLAKGWLLDKGKWYFLDKTTGAMQKGWVLDGKKWYYLNSNGDMATGWVKVSGKWYFLDKTNGDMKTGWVLDGKKWYCLNSNGDMAAGWVKVSGKWYFLDKTSGAMNTGWVLDGKKWYYLNGSGAMVTGWSKVGNKWYYFYSDGHMR